MKTNAKYAIKIYTATALYHSQSIELKISFDFQDLDLVHIYTILMFYVVTIKVYTNLILAI